MADTLLIPSAAFVPDELKLDLGPIPTGMIPLHGRPTIEHIVNSYKELIESEDLHIVVACPAEDKTIQNWVDTSAYDWQIVEIKDSPTLGHTIFQTLDSIEMDSWENGNLYIQFADSIVQNPLSTGDSDQITVDQVNHPIRWTVFDTDTAGDIRNVFEKFANVENKPENTFVGHFKLTNPRGFYQNLQNVLQNFPSAEHADGSLLDPFYRALLSYLNGRQYNLVKPDEWIDVGHLDTYHRAKTEFLNIRGFNEITVDNERNVLRKQSSNPDILSAEINWYQDLPKELTLYVPRIIDYSVSDNPFIEMEYVGHPSVSDIYMYGNHGLHIWNSIFSSIFSTFDIFGTYESPDDKYIADALRDMYLNKTERRLDRASSQPELEQFFMEKPININGETYKSVPSILTTLHENLDAFDLLEPVVPSVIHGDMCFANVLCDVRTGIIKLIDPRGAFGEYDIYGDPRYDLAKLMHSISGKYEFIINDRFDIDINDESDVSYTIYSEERHDRREELFYSLLESRYPDTVEQIAAIESLLWLSMVPLHSDVTDRQKIMLAQGIEKYNKIFLD